MNKEDLKRGFGCLLLAIIIIGISLIFTNTIDNKLEENTTIESQEEVPLQDAVGDNEVIAKTNSKKNTKKVVKKKTTKKVVKKKTIKKISKRYSTITSSK